MNPVRLLIVIVLLFGFALAKRLYRQWRARVAADQRPAPRLPGELLGTGARSWVIFTTPFCASCGPVADTLRRFDPDASVITIDATREPHLAQAFRIKAAPTALLADAAGRVHTRLVGAEAVTQYYVSNPA